MIFWVDSGVTALLFVLHFSGVWHLPHMLRLEQAFVAIAFVYLIILMIACVRKGNRQSRLVICGVILFCCVSERNGQVIWQENTGVMKCHGQQDFHLWEL